MRIVPVIDLMGGVVVRGVAGRRSEYRPLVSPLVGTCEPGAVTRVLLGRVRTSELYVADLDAITGQAALSPAALAVLQAARPASVWLDAGVRRASDATALLEAGVGAVVAGLETLSGADELGRVVAAAGAGRVVFSLDLREGVPMSGAGWPADADAAAELAIAAGVRRLIVLDVARVGTGGGAGTEALCRRLADRYPGVELVAGGGVKGPADLERLAAAGVSAALVASALHDGRLPVTVP